MGQKERLNIDPAGLTSWCICDLKVKQHEQFFFTHFKSFYKERVACIAGGISRAGDILAAR